MANQYEIVFQWPSLEANDVVVTGTFDSWSKSLHMKKGAKGFEGRVSVPWGSKVLYKFVVDGQWFNHDEQPLEPDSIGNVNNVYYAPMKPAAATIRVAAEADSSPTERCAEPVPPTSPISAAAVRQGLDISTTGNASGVTTAELGSSDKDKSVQNGPGAPPFPALAPVIPNQIQPIADAASGGVVNRHADKPPSKSEQEPPPEAKGAPAPVDDSLASVPEVSSNKEARSTHKPIAATVPVTPLNAGNESTAAVIVTERTPLTSSAAGEEPEPATPADATTPAPPTTEKKVNASRPHTPRPAAPSATAPTTPEKGANGAAFTANTPAKTVTTSAPSTPANKRTFPSGGSISASGGSVDSIKKGSQRKKRHSLLGKLKAIFSHDKEKEKAKE